MNLSSSRPYQAHLQSSGDLVTTYAATRAGFVALANVDISLFNIAPAELQTAAYKVASTYLALGELKGGIDPAGADEHWKTARSALDRIRTAFADTDTLPHLFFIGAAIEKKMADEIWQQLESGDLVNAANLNEENQLASIARWLCTL